METSRPDTHFETALQASTISNENAKHISIERELFVLCLCMRLPQYYVRPTDHSTDLLMKTCLPEDKPKVLTQQEVCLRQLPNPIHGPMWHAMFALVPTSQNNRIYSSKISKKEPTRCHKKHLPKYKDEIRYSIVQV